MKITVLYFDETAEPTQVNEAVAAVRSVVDNDVIALPKNFDLMLDCSLDQLVNVRALIDTAIQVKIAEESDDSSTQELDLMNIGAKLPPS